MKFGVSYYPELTPENEWGRDLDRMVEAGLSAIRMLDFAWPKFEPREGCYTFEWLDRFLALAGKKGLEVILCTPTASPPAWLATQYPQIMIERRDGTRTPFGGRRGVCANSPIYRHFCVNLARRLAERYGDHPAVVGWQLDNELIGDETIYPECHCPECQWSFRDWLKRHHASVDALNQAWGTGFWNQLYSDWGEIATPRSHLAVKGHVIDYQRFFSDSQVEFLSLQRDALRGVIAKRQWIGHNSTGVFDRALNHTAYSQAMDVAGWDAYLGDGNYAYIALAHNMFRSANNKPFIVYETNSDDSGAISYWAEMLARGARSVFFWHYRQHRFNSEQNCPALCDHSGEPFPGRLERIQEAVDTLGRIELPKRLIPADTAILYDVDNVSFHHRDASPWERGHDRTIPYLDALVDAYRPFWQDGVHMDLRTPGEDLSGYKLILMPSMLLMEPEFALRISHWVEAGGVLFATAKTAQLDKHGGYHAKPGALVEDMLGCRLGDVESKGRREASMDGQSYPVDGWDETVTPTGAEVLGRFADGSPAALHHRFGKGQVFYVACRSLGLNQAVERLAVAAAGVESLPQDDARITSAPAPDGAGRWVFNHGTEPVIIREVKVGPKSFARLPAGIPVELNITRDSERQRHTEGKSRIGKHENTKNARFIEDLGCD